MDRLAYQFFQDEGYVVIKNLFEESEIEAIKEEYFKLWIDLIREGKISTQTKRPLEGLFPRIRDHHLQNDAVLSFILNRRLIETVEELIGEELLVVSTSYYYKGPQSRGIPDHQDNLAVCASPGTTYSVWISLDKADRENGRLHFYRKTHTLELLTPRNRSGSAVEDFSDTGQKIELDPETEIVYVDTDPGDVVIFHGNLVHGSRDNESMHRFRRSLLVHTAGVSVEKLLLNFNNLISRNGERVRKRLNTTPKLTEGQSSIFSVKEASYYSNNDWKK